MRYGATLIDQFRTPRNAGTMRENEGVGEGNRAHAAEVVSTAIRAAARDAPRRMGEP